MILPVISYNALYFRVAVFKMLRGLRVRAVVFKTLEVGPSLGSGKLAFGQIATGMGPCPVLSKYLRTARLLLFPNVGVWPRLKSSD